MKTTLKYFCITFLAITTLLACKPSENKNTKQETNLPAKLETVALSIEGMTCEIGCAKTIESKISKLAGVSESKVDFESKKGTFTYDANKTSETAIVNTINGLLDGKTYSATVSKNCCATKEVKACTEACAKECGHEVGEACEKCESEKKEACCAVDHKKGCDQACAEKCGHKVGEACTMANDKKDTCVAAKDKDCAKACAEKIGHKEGESCKTNCKKACCAAKSE